MTAHLISGATVRGGELIDQRALRLASGLVQFGLGEGDVVAVMLRNHPAYIEIMQSARIAGCYTCQVNWHFKRDEVRHILADSAARVLFVGRDLLEAVADALPSEIKVIAVGPPDTTMTTFGPAVDYESWIASLMPYCGAPRALRGHMAYTSGTTGRPKGIRRDPVPPEQLAHQQARMLSLMQTTFGIRPAVRALISAPLYHSAAGLFAQQAMLHGELLVLEERFDAEETLALIATHRIQVVYLVPVMYVRLLRLPEQTRARYDLSSLEFVASTGSPCAPHIKQAMIDWLGPVIHETYASSETGMLTIADSALALRKPGCAGSPVGDALIRILDPQGHPCPPGVIGLIYGRQPVYPDFTYNNNDAARRQIERDGLLCIGDMGYVDSDGDLFICDRSSDMVISGGVNIYPSEIEHVLSAVPGVADCVVFGVPDEEYGEALAAHVTPEADIVLAREDISNHLRTRIAAYKVPRHIEIVDSLPRDDNGKIARRKIRDVYWREQQRLV